MDINGTKGKGVPLGTNKAKKPHPSEIHSKKLGAKFLQLRITLANGEITISGIGSLPWQSTSRLPLVWGCIIFA